jgi:hypothetical protein
MPERKPTLAEAIANLERTRAETRRVLELPGLSGLEQQPVKVAPRESQQPGLDTTINRVRKRNRVLNEQ